MIGLGLGWFFFDGQRVACRVEFHHAIALRIGDLVGEDDSAFGVAALAQGGGKAVAFEDVIAQYQGHGVIADEILRNEEGLR